MIYACKIDNGKLLSQFGQMWKSKQLLIQQINNLYVNTKINLSKY